MRNISPVLAGLAALCLLLLGACLGPEPEGIAPAVPARTTVKIDFLHRPLPEIPLPNDIATRYDVGSATGLRLNASVLAPTRMESRVRELIDGLDGWGIFQPISIPFTGPLDVQSILDGHRDKNYDLSNDVIYLVNIDESSKNFGRVHHLDLGNGNYPVVLEDLNRYWKNDPRGWTISTMFEEEDEDLNRNGVLDAGEDTDFDGELDIPNYLPGKSPARSDLAGRADALMTFYERQTNTLIARPLVPLDERTTYAVVVTRRLKDASGEPVGSPYPYINHASQTEALRPLTRVLPAGLSLDQVAFAFSFTTQSVQSSMVAVRDGLYGHGVQAHLGRDFPAEVGELLKMRDPAAFPGLKNPYVLYSEQLEPAFKLLAVALLGQAEGSVAYEKVLEAMRYVDYVVIGSFQSPQLFERTDGSGNRLPLNEQRWPEDLDRRPAPARGETVYFTLTVPRPEISARGEGKPAPTVVVSHGYTSSRAEALVFGAYLARAGLAALAIDCPSHGLGLSETEELLARGAGIQFGVEPFVNALLKGRAEDLNADGRKDSGGDYWTAYTFHTRDMVRQSALDYMQLIRIFRSFDGVRQWSFDLRGTGQPGVAGDFDGDGKVDVGGSAPMHMTGGSLGGIMSLFVGGVEPHLTSIIPVSGAGGLSDVGLRSKQGGVPEPVFLRVMGPLYVGTLETATGEMKLETIVPDLNGRKEATLGKVTGVGAGDTVVVENLKNGERGCAVVSTAGQFRAAVPSDLGDATRLSFYDGRVLLPGPDCRVREGARPKLTVEKFLAEVVFQGKLFAEGEPLVALAEGLALKRGTPDLRRFISLAQMVLDPGDPASMARHYHEPLRFPGTGEQTGTHALVVTTLGDMNVPASTGATAARAAGLIEYLQDDPRYGKPPNQVLIDTYTYEAVNTLKRYTTPGGQGVHLDIENFSEGKDMWGNEVPRLDPPLRLGFTDKKDPLGGVSAAIFPLAIPTGQHGFDQPGVMTDAARAACKKACTDKEGPDPCGCSSKQTFDIGNFMFNLISRYFISEGKHLGLDPCYSADNCPDRKPVPPQRTSLP